MSDTNLIIRSEKESDYRAVEEMVREAFWNLYIPGCGEHYTLHKVRMSGDFIPELDFVAERDGRIVGQIVYARSIIKYEQGMEKEVVTFGPVCVLPSLQKQGIGSALITHTTALARDMGFPAVCIYGDPRYYSRFGFRLGDRYDIKTADGKFAVGLLVLELKQGELGNLPGRFIESPAYGEFDENEFAQYDATFPFREKAETESQREFRFMVSLRY